MVFENLYKISSVKSKVQQVRQLYNTRHKVNWLDFDVTTATGLIKSFIRDLPSPILTNELLPKFEEASANSSEIEMQNLISQLPLCNQTLLSWLMVHLHNVISHVSIYFRRERERVGGINLFTFKITIFKLNLVRL